MKTRKFTYVNRYCECCGSDQLEKLWVYKYDAKTVNNVFEFNVNNVICQKCGFVFVSPSPSSEELLDYYSDSYSKFSEQKIDYNIGNRILFIQKHIKNNDLFVEFGSNLKTNFHKELEFKFKRVITIEPNSSASSDFKNASEITYTKADMISHYFVLEHVPEVRKFLKDCYNLLKRGGIMICEVPLIDIYPEDMSALILHEHVNHFSLNNLISLAETEGFTFLDSSLELCSRRFGFATAFVKKKVTQNGRLKERLNGEYEKNKAFFLNGMEKAIVHNNRKIKLYNSILELYYQKKRIIIWGVNEEFRRLFAHKKIPSNVVAIDSDPRKKNYLDNIQVLLPFEAEELIKSSDHIIVCSKIHYSDILSQIRADFQKEFKHENISIFSY